MLINFYFNVRQLHHAVLDDYGRIWYVNSEDVTLGTFCTNCGEVNNALDM